MKFTDQSRAKFILSSSWREQGSCFCKTLYKVNMMVFSCSVYRTHWHGGSFCCHHRLLFTCSLHTLSAKKAAGTKLSLHPWREDQSLEKSRDPGWWLQEKGRGYWLTLPVAAVEAPLCLPTSSIKYIPKESSMWLGIVDVIILKKTNIVLNKRPLPYS